MRELSGIEHIFLPEIGMSLAEVSTEAAWLEIERRGWVPTPQLLFALKEVIEEEMLGG